VRIWRRGTALTEAKKVFAGQPTDVHVGAEHDPTPGFARDFVYRVPSLFTSEMFLLEKGAG